MSFVLPCVMGPNVILGRSELECKTNARTSVRELKTLPVLKCLAACIPVL